jgi:hypothetical protein
MPDTLPSALEDIRAQLQEASDRAQNILANLSPELAGLRPDPASWSVAECIAHLSLTTDAYTPVIREALADGRQRNVVSTSGSFRANLNARLLAWWLEPPYQFKARTPAAFVPGLRDPMQALPGFLERQQYLFDLLTDAKGLAIDRLRIVSPFARQMRYSVYSGFVLIAAHQRRHLWQAEQIARRVVAAANP